jgi:hypothetical protein
MPGHVVGGVLVGGVLVGTGLIGTGLVWQDRGGAGLVGAGHAAQKARRPEVIQQTGDEAMKTLVDDRSSGTTVSEEQEVGLDASRAAVHAGQSLADSLATSVAEAAPVVRRATPTLIVAVVCATAFTAALAWYVLLPAIKTLVSTVPGAWDPAP